MLMLPAIAFALLEPVDLDAHAWAHRPVLVFAADEGVPMLATQRRAWGGAEGVVLGSSAAQGFWERDVVVYVVTPTSVTREGALGAAPMAPSPALRERFAPEGDFTVVLVGKDGGEKMRVSGEVLTRDALFARIDSMPMRRSEMESRE